MSGRARSCPRLPPAPRSPPPPQSVRRAPAPPAGRGPVPRGDRCPHAPPPPHGPALCCPMDSVGSDPRSGLRGSCRAAHLTVSRVGPARATGPGRDREGPGGPGAARARLAPHSRAVSAAARGQDAGFSASPRRRGLPGPLACGSDSLRVAEGDPVRGFPASEDCRSRVRLTLPARRSALPSARPAPSAPRGPHAPRTVRGARSTARGPAVLAARPQEQGRPGAVSRPDGGASSRWGISAPTRAGFGARGCPRRPGRGRGRLWRPRGAVSERTRLPCRGRTCWARAGCLQIGEFGAQPSCAKPRTVFPPRPGDASRLRPPNGRRVSSGGRSSGLLRAGPFWICSPGSSLGHWPW